MGSGKLGAAAPGIIILVMGILGLFLAAAEQIAYDNDFIINLYMEATEIPALQIVTIVLFLICGGILAAMNS